MKLGSTLLFTIGLALGSALPAAALQPAPSGGPIPVALQEWSVTPSTGSVASGSVLFQAVNQGTVEHELVIFKTDRDPAALPLTSDGAVDEAAAGTEIGELDDLDPGETKAASFDLSPGKYVLICNVPGHYQQGMRTAFIVQ